MMHPSSFADLHDPLLVTLINTLQDIFASVAVCNPIDLPQISIIGSQGIGKNLMLASILGKDLFVLLSRPNPIVKCLTSK